MKLRTTSHAANRILISVPNLNDIFGICAERQQIVLSGLVQGLPDILQRTFDGSKTTCRRPMLCLEFFRRDPGDNPIVNIRRNRPVSVQRHFVFPLFRHDRIPAS